jgi:hypothetical protein
MEAVMVDKLQLAAAAMALLALGPFLPIPAFAGDGGRPALWSAPSDHDPVQLADTVQSTESSASSSASSSSSVTVTGGKQGKCTAEAIAKAKANDVEDSDHDLKVTDGDGCSAKSESRAVVKPQQRQQSD